MTTIAAMEFEARIISLVTGHPVETEEHPRAPFAVQTTSDDWDDLAEVLPELLHEQASFDRWLTKRDAGVGRAQRALLTLMILVMLALAVLGLLEL